MNYKTKRIVYVALLIAIEFVLSRFLSVSTVFIKISLSFVAPAICGMLFGPLWAGVAAAVTDVLGALLFPQAGQPIFFGFTLSAFLMGFTFGVFFYNRKATVLRTLAAAFIDCIIINFCLGSYWLYLMMGDSIIARLPDRLIKNIVMIPIQVLVIVIVARMLSGQIEEHFASYRRYLRGNSKRFYLKEGNRQSVSDAICKNIAESVQFKQAKTVFCFVGTEKEASTDGIIAEAMLQGKCVCIPRCENDGGMTARYISQGEQLVPGAFGILEPPAMAEIAKREDIDIAIVPCSACDRKGARLGRGSGYYDRYLINSKIFKIGICPTKLMVMRLPSSTTDIPMNAVATEKGIRR